jgi:hypothetical protein
MEKEVLTEKKGLLEPGGRAGKGAALDPAPSALPRRLRGLSSILSLTLDGSRLEGVVLKRTNGSVKLEQPFAVSLTLDPLTAAPELVGREIRNHLDAAEVRERNCVVGLPIKWALMTNVDIPDIPGADVAAFLQIEAERGFHADVETLVFGASQARLTDGKRQALLAGMPRNNVLLLENALEAAKLKPLSFSLGITALQGPDPSGGALALAIGDTQVALQVTGGGGIAALRALDGVLESEGSKKILHADLAAREARITLGQLPAELRDSVKSIRVFGPRDLAQQLADELELKLEALGLKAEAVSRYQSGGLPLQLPADAPVTPATSLGARVLAGQAPIFEFLPPKVKAWQRVANRYSSGKRGLAGAVGLVLAVSISGSFAYQEWQLSKLQNQWAAMQGKVKELKEVTDQIHRFRPWYDGSMRALTILKRMTVAFPPDPSVTAKSIEIHDLNAVTCTGTTSDQARLQAMLSKLGKQDGVTEITRGPVRGNKPPLQFSFEFHYAGGGKNEN